MQTTKPEEVIKNLDRARAVQYEAYFDTLAPRSIEDVFRRWIFAFASVHTSWESNIKLYTALKDLTWLGNIHVLRKRIQDSRAGLHNNRADNIMRFADFFWRHPFWFNRIPGESWFALRDRIMERAPGIGPAKAAFLLELVYFHKSNLACFDTHMIQLYGYTANDLSRVRPSVFTVMEKHWTQTCEERNISPVTARWLYWDQKQQKPDSRYWSYVLEDNYELAKPA